jgi:pimeloyl-ACP methyl ester carboxylesterase
MLSDIMRINILCVAPLSSSLPKVSELTSKYYAVPIFNSTSDNQDSDTYISIAGLPEIIPQCCMYGKCQACYKTPSKNPLILLHGHSFNQDTHAYQSIEVFNGFEQNLSNDKSYFQTGILLQGGNSTAGILGHYYIPPVIKPTYYLETYNDLLGLTVSESKTGNIDTYALRLKESIDYTMFVTGSTKVDIVAHSMGGLVVRRYMQIFGTKNIGTVILVATPNQGISDRTYGLCKIFGALNECDDMRSDGIFIKKLNDFSDQPDIKNIYLVIGSGCDTDGLDGDGIVTANNSMMLGFPKSHVLYVKGVCSGTTFLHNELLDINKYPEVYEYVKSKLGN